MHESAPPVNARNKFNSDLIIQMVLTACLICGTMDLRSLAMQITIDIASQPFTVDFYYKVTYLGTEEDKT